MKGQPVYQALSPAAPPVAVSASAAHSCGRTASCAGLAWIVLAPAEMLGVDSGSGTPR
jgi:hypothetical protein